MNYCFVAEPFDCRHGQVCSRPTIKERRAAPMRAGLWQREVRDLRDHIRHCIPTAVQGFRAAQLTTCHLSSGALRSRFREAASRSRPTHVLVWLDRPRHPQRARCSPGRHGHFRPVAPPRDRLLLRLAVLWPGALTGLRIFIVDWATFDADFLNSVWVAAVPAFVGAAVITYCVPARLADRVWTSWLLVAPIGGLVVLGYSLLQRRRNRPSLTVPARRTVELAEGDGERLFGTSTDGS
jgi:hypothetical protein